MKSQGEKAPRKNGSFLGISAPRAADSPLAPMLKVWELFSRLKSRTNLAQTLGKRDFPGE